EKGHVELVVRLKRGLDLRFIECGHKAVSLIGNDATREKILFEESPRFRPVRIVEGARGGKDRRQRFETDAKTAALVDLASSVIGRTAKCGECSGLIVPVPARTIRKGHRAQNPRQAVHRRIRLSYTNKKAAGVSGPIHMFSLNLPLRSLQASSSDRATGYRGQRSTNP